MNMCLPCFDTNCDNVEPADPVVNMVYSQVRLRQPTQLALFLHGQRTLRRAKLRVRSGFYLTEYKHFSFFGNNIDFPVVEPVIGGTYPESMVRKIRLRKRLANTTPVGHAPSPRSSFLLFDFPPPELRPDKSV